MLAHLYLRKGMVFIPVVAKTDSGFYLDIEPVAVAEASDRDGLMRAIKEALSRDNPVIPTPMRDAFPKPVVLKYANVKSWSTFEKGTSLWSVDAKDSVYQIRPQRKHPEGGWEDDPAKTEILPCGITIDEIVQRIAKRVQSADGK